MRALLSTSHTGVAPLYIIINAVCAGVLVWMPYTLLVEFSMLLSVPSILLFMWSFVALRIQRPFVDRPFLIPGGLPMAVLLTVVPVAISISYAAIITTESSFSFDPDASSSEQRSRSSDGGLPPIFQVISMGAVIALGCLVHLAFYSAGRHGYTCGMGSGASDHADDRLDPIEMTPRPPQVRAFANDSEEQTAEDEHDRLTTLAAPTPHSAAPLLGNGGICKRDGKGGGGSSSSSGNLSDKVRTVVSSIGGGGSKGSYSKIGCCEPP